MLILLYNNVEKIKSNDRTKELEQRILSEGLRELHIEGADSFAASMIRHSADGKPFLPDYPGFHFNFSHSGSLLACAFSEREIGLDLQAHEHVSSGRWENISKRFFTAEEYEALRAAPERQTQAGLFFRLWTLKEAYLKYIGCGLRGEMNSFLPVPLPVASLPGTGFPDPVLSDELLSGASLDEPSLSAVPISVEKNHTEYFPASETGLPDSKDTVSPFYRGRVRILKEKNLLTPASCALLPAPSGYSMAVCAKELPETFCVRLCRGFP